MARLSFRCDAELVERVDAERGLIPREAWLRRAVEQVLSGSKEPSPRTQADPGSIPSSEGVRSAAPAEHPLGLGHGIADGEGNPVRAYGVDRQPRRSSSQSKRDVRPRPKGGK